MVFTAFATDSGSPETFISESLPTIFYAVYLFYQLYILVKASKQSNCLFHTVNINTLFEHSITFAHELHHFKIEMILLLQDSISQIIPQIPLFFVTHFTTFFWIFVPKLRLFHVNFRFLGNIFFPHTGRA